MSETKKPAAEPEKTTPVVDMIDVDFFETLTGFEEIAIKKSWPGVVITKVGKEDPSTWLRCLVFIHFKREKHPDPKNDALALSLAQLGAFFAEDPERAKNPLQEAHKALTAVVDAQDLETAQAAARKVLDDQEAGGASGEAG